MNWKRCTFYSKSKHEERLSNFFVYCVIYWKRRKRNISLLRKIPVSQFFFTNSNIYCINLEMLEDLAFLWMTELIFSCKTTVSQNWFTSVLHGVDQLLVPVNRYSSPGQLDDIPQFLCSYWCLFENNCIFAHHHTIN